MKRILLLTALLACCAGRANAACSGSSPTWTAASANSADIAACISVASNGDTILVSGTGTFSSSPTIPSTLCVTINGQGTTTITSSNIGFTLNQGTSCESRITGFNFTGGTGNGIGTSLIGVQMTAGGFCFRVDHNTFSNTSATAFLYIFGADNACALIDHNTFASTNVTSEEVHVLGGTLSNSGFPTVGWNDNVVPGGANMVFFENNTFTGVNCGTSAIQGYSGSQTVMRHNTFVSIGVDQHGTAGYNGVRWYEIYDNTFNDNGVNMCYEIDLRAGTGVVFGNVVTNYGGGADLIQVYEEDTGTWPLAYQIGSGINGYTNAHNSCASGSLNSAPLYFWALDPNMSVSATISPTYVQLNRDYFVSTLQPSTMTWQESTSDTCSTTYSYTPYTYPHPLDTSGSTTGSSVGGGVKCTGGCSIQ